MDMELEQLRARLKETEDTLDAIRHGRIDALVVGQPNKQQVFTLQSADYTYRVLIESMSQGALIVSEAGTILYSNRQFSLMIGRPLEQIIGVTFSDVLPVADDTAIRKLFIGRRKSSKPSEIECQLLDDNQTSLVISASLLPKNSDSAHMSIVVTDITGRKRAEMAKDEFVSLASHQLRTPATGVKQYLGMLLDDYAEPLSELQRTYVSTAYNSNEQQIAIISAILKTAQVDSGVYNLVKTVQNLAALANTTAGDYLPLLLMRKQRIEIVVPPTIEVAVDPVEFAVVLSNLIENASKYTPDGETITIRGSQTTKSVAITVQDHGVGIKHSDQAMIFDKFTRIDNPLSDTVTGSGLGLYWTKRIVDLHGGTISVKSALGKGTTFTVKLPR